jgi:hypothetical protein
VTRNSAISAGRGNIVGLLTVTRPRSAVPVDGVGESRNVADLGRSYIFLNG